LYVCVHIEKNISKYYFFQIMNVFKTIIKEISFLKKNFKENFLILTLNCHTSPESHSCHTGTSQTPVTKTLTAEKLLTFLNWKNS